MPDGLPMQAMRNKATATTLPKMRGPRHHGMGRKRQREDEETAPTLPQILTAGWHATTDAALQPNNLSICGVCITLFRERAVIAKHAIALGPEHLLDQLGEVSYTSTTAELRAILQWEILLGSLTDQQKREIAEQGELPLQTDSEVSRMLSEGAAHSATLAQAELGARVVIMLEKTWTRVTWFPRSENETSDKGAGEALKKRLQRME